MTTTTTSVPPQCTLAWADPRLGVDPIGVLAPIRELGPVVRNVAEDELMVMSYRDCARVFGDSRMFSSSILEERFMDIFGGLTMESLDEKGRHGELRGVWADAFQRSTLDRDRRGLINEVLDLTLGPAIERVKSGEVVDVVSQAVRLIPTLVIAHMLGLDPEMQEQFVQWSDAQMALLAGSSDHTPDGQKLVRAGRDATAAMNAHMATEIARRRVRSSSDLVSDIVKADVGLSERDLVASVTQLVLAGNETTARLMAHAFVVLANHPDQRRRLVQDPSLVRGAADELLRYETIVQSTARIAVEDCEIAGVAVSAGSVLKCMMGIANRDPDRWDRPNEFDVSRKARAHLGYGFGMHICLGLSLARLEVELVLGRLLTQLPNWSIVGDIDYGRSFPIRGPVAVMIAAS